MWTDEARAAALAARQANAGASTKDDTAAAHQSGVSDLKGKQLEAFLIERDHQRAAAKYLAARRTGVETVAAGRKALGVSRSLDAPLAPGQRETRRGDMR